MEYCIDYDPCSETTRNFYAHVQDKFHFAITGKTASQIIHARSDANKPVMGLGTYKDAPDDRVLKSDVVRGKNYLFEKEIKRLDEQCPASSTILKASLNKEPCSP